MADKHIKLIVTGMSEKKSLHESLRKYFPTHTANGDLVIWDTPRKAYGVTGHRLKAANSPSTSMVTLVNTMFAEAIAGKLPNSRPADLVIVIDDVELGNVGRENIVGDTFLAAVHAKLVQLKAVRSPPEFQAIQALIQRCCSFHLLCPMVEAYFFADLTTLISGGVSNKHPPLLSHPTDVEQFDSSPDINALWRSTCEVKNREQNPINPWWKTERHPKRYLTHLLSISGAPLYHETTLGARMIEATNWSTVAKVTTDTPIVSALLGDIWDWFGQTPPSGYFQGMSSTGTYQVKTTPPGGRMLRNI